jgi:hypothetical protein
MATRGVVSVWSLAGCECTAPPGVELRAAGCSGRRQVRFALPAWLGVGVALKDQIDQGNLSQLQDMYYNWPFFQSTIDLVEMVMAKSDLRIAKVYDDKLITDPKLKVGHRLSLEWCDTQLAPRSFTGQKPACSAALLAGPGTRHDRLVGGAGTHNNFSQRTRRGTHNAERCRPGWNEGRLERKYYK